MKCSRAVIVARGDENRREGGPARRRRPSNPPTCRRRPWPKRADRAEGSGWNSACRSESRGRTSHRIGAPIHCHRSGSKAAKRRACRPVPVSSGALASRERAETLEPQVAAQQALPRLASSPPTPFWLRASPRVLPPSFESHLRPTFGPGPSAWNSSARQAGVRPACVPCSFEQQAGERPAYAPVSVPCFCGPWSCARWTYAPSSCGRRSSAPVPVGPRSAWSRSSAPVLFSPLAFLPRSCARLSCGP